MKKSEQITRLEATLAQRDGQVARLLEFKEALEGEIKEKIAMWQYYHAESAQRLDKISELKCKIGCINGALSDVIPDTDIMKLDYAGMQEVVDKIRLGE